MKLPCLVAAAALLAPLAASAHDAWIEPRGAGWAVVFGHGDEPTEIAPEKIRSVAALDADGRALPVQQRPADKAVQLAAQGRPALWVLSFDNGYWSKAPGSTQPVNKPRTEVPGATGGTHALKFGKTVAAWGAVAARPQGQRLEIVPLDAAAPAAGRALPVQVWWEGRPLPKARLLREGAPAGTPPVEADADGKAQLPVVAGRQMWTVAHRAELRDEPRADVVSAAANLVFTAR